MTIFYFLEDKSMMITEPKEMNSGCPQGAFLKRQMVLKNDGSQSPFMPDDFAVGCDISIYGRVIRIYDCDGYTREFFEVSNNSLQRRAASFSLCRRWLLQPVTAFG